MNCRRWNNCRLPPRGGCSRWNDDDPRGDHYPVGPFTAYMGDPDEDYKEDEPPNEPCDDGYYYRGGCAVPRMGMGIRNMGDYNIPCGNTAEAMMERRAMMNRGSFCDHMDDFGPVGPFEPTGNDMHDEHANYNRYIRRVNNRFYSYEGDNYDSNPVSYPENAPTEAQMERERNQQNYLRYERWQRANDDFP